MEGLEIVCSSQGRFLCSLSWAPRKRSIFTDEIFLLIHGPAQKRDIQFSSQIAWSYGAQTVSVVNLVLPQKQDAEGPTRRKVYSL